MKQVFPHLWLGHARDALEYRQLFDAGIEAVVELAVEEPPSSPPRELLYLRFPLVDGVGNDAKLLRLVVRSVAGLLEERWPVLVCCSSGLSRSPAVAATALTLAHGGAPEDWLRRVTEHHPSDVSPGLWGELLGFLPLESSRRGRA